MPKSYSRAERVEDLLQNTLAEILQRKEEALHFGLITITGVKISPDFSFAKVYVSLLYEDKAKEAIHALNEESKEIRYELAHSVKLRITPELKFIYDDSAVRGQHISSLIDKVLKDKDEKHGH